MEGRMNQADNEEAVHNIEFDAPVEIFNEDVETDEEFPQLPCTSEHADDEFKTYDEMEIKGFIKDKGDDEQEEGLKKIIIELRSPYGTVLKFPVTNGEILESMRTEMNFHLTKLFECGLPIKQEYEKTAGWNELTFDDVDDVARIIREVSICVDDVIERYDGTIRDHMTSEWFMNETCDAEMAKTFSNMALDRNMGNAGALNKGYKPFSNEVYGETSFDQTENILNELPLSESDVMVDMGSGVGNVIIYAAARSKARRCIGIEVNEGPARRAKKIKEDFIEIMDFYGKSYRPFNLIHKSFLDDKFKKLITQQASLIYLNNYQFDQKLMAHILGLFEQCKTGTKIVALNSLMREREDTEIMIDEDGKEIEVKIVRDVSEKAIGRGVATPDMFIDVSKDITLAEFPCSWADGKNLRFQPFTINQEKLIRLFVKRIKEDEERISMKRAKTEAKENMEKCKTEGNNNEDETEEKENGVRKKTVKAKGSSKTSRAVFGNSIVQNNSVTPRSLATLKSNTKQSYKKSVKRSQVYYVEALLDRKEQSDGSFKYETAWMSYSERTWEPRECFDGSDTIKMADELDSFLDDGAPLPSWLSDFKKKIEEENEAKTSSLSSRKVAKRKAALDEVKEIEDDTNTAEYPLRPQTAYQFWMYLEGLKYGVTASMEWKKISDNTKWKEMEKKDKARHESEMKLYKKRKM